MLPYRHVVAPEPAWEDWEGCAAGDDFGAWADDIHGAVVIGVDGDGKFVCPGVEDIAGGFPFVDDRGTGLLSWAFCHGPFVMGLLSWVFCHDRGTGLLSCVDDRGTGLLS